jgi:Nucleotide modification associated domain 2
MLVRAYTLTVNVNHAPHVGNHDGRVLLTLADCKPGIRRIAKKDEWIAAITPKKMEYRLAYLMRVGGCWTREEYWGKFKQTRADSIYKPGTAGRFKLLENPFHGAENSARDTSCNRILWSDEFYYFAESYDWGETTPHGLIIDPAYDRLCRSMRTRYGYLIEMPDDFVEWVKRRPGRLEKLRTLSPEKGHTCGNCQPGHSSRRPCSV